MPRNRVRSGIDQASGSRTRPASATRSGLPLASSGIGVERDDLARRPGPRVHRGHPVARVGRGPRSPDDEGDQAVAPLLVGHADHLGVAHRRVLAQPRGDGGPGTLTPPVTTTSSTRPSTCEAAVVVDAADVGGEEPAVDQHLGGQRRVAVVAARTASARRSGSGRRCRAPRPRRPAARRRRRSRRRSRGAVGRDDLTPLPRRARAAPGRSAAAEQHGVGPASAARSAGSSSIRCSWVGTREMNHAGRRSGHVLGPEDRVVPGDQRAARPPACRRRRSAAAPAATGPAPPRRRAVASTEASTAARDSTTRLGRRSTRGLDDQRLGLAGPPARRHGRPRRRRVGRRRR